MRLRTVSGDDELCAPIAGIEATFGLDIDGWLARLDSPFVVVAPGAVLVVDDHDQARVRPVGDRLALVDARFTHAAKATDRSSNSSARPRRAAGRGPGWRTTSLLAARRDRGPLTKVSASRRTHA